MLIWAVAVRVVMVRGAFGKGWRVLVLWSRWRLRSMVMRRLPMVVMAAFQWVVMVGRGRLAVAWPWRVVAIAVRRVAVKEISR
jgi:hypothetical protein